MQNQRRYGNWFKSRKERKRMKAMGTTAKGTNAIGVTAIGVLIVGEGESEKMRIILLLIPKYFCQYLTT